MTKTWILVAHRGGARLFENRGPGKGMALLQNFDNPAGKLKNQEIDSDRPGRHTDARNNNRHGYGHDQEPTVHIAELFAKQLANTLDQGRQKQQFSRLILVADPRFLGLLRSNLPNPTATLVTDALDKDLGQVEARDLPKYLSSVVYV